MGHVPAIPDSTRASITWRLILHAEKNWPQLDKVQVTCRGAFAYAAGVLPGGEKIPLFRLRYGGSAHSFGLAIYSAARERYEDALFLTGFPTGTPQEALDTACTIHLTGLGHEPDSEPSTNLRDYPLSMGADDMVELLTIEEVAERLRVSVLTAVAAAGRLLRACDQGWPPSGLGRPGGGRLAGDPA